jgi:hypothetical protein
MLVTYCLSARSSLYVKTLKLLNVILNNVGLEGILINFFNKLVSKPHKPTGKVTYSRFSNINSCNFKRNMCVLKKLS